MIDSLPFLAGTRGGASEAGGGEALRANRPPHAPSAMPLRITAILRAIAEDFR